jgi:hypothetical protein
LEKNNTCSLGYFKEEAAIVDLNISIVPCIRSQKKGKAIPVTDRGGVMAVRLPALRSDRSLPTWKIPGTHFC